VIQSRSPQSLPRRVEPQPPSRQAVAPGHVAPRVVRPSRGVTDSIAGALAAASGAVVWTGEFVFLVGGFLLQAVRYGVVGAVAGFFPGMLISAILFHTEKYAPVGIIGGACVGVLVAAVDTFGDR
jgi:hypothetical protein